MRMMVMLAALTASCSLVAVRPSPPVKLVTKLGADAAAPQCTSLPTAPYADLALGSGGVLGGAGVLVDGLAKDNFSASTALIGASVLVAGLAFLLVSDRAFHQTWECDDARAEFERVSRKPGAPAALPTR